MTPVSLRMAGCCYFAAMIEFPSQAELIKKYDVPTPRYTSYPTVPHWETAGFTPEKWTNAVRRAFDESNDATGISIYVHLPFCERLCTYCACNKRITKNHGVEIKYIQTVLREWAQYIRIFEAKPVIRELHFGGGTPTFFSPENLSWLVSELLGEGYVHEANEFSFEGHPNNTTEAHLQALYDGGFRRVSFGVQDLDPKVQKTINRIQPFENVEAVTRLSRAIGYRSISFDLIYGLPFQTKQTIANTMKKVLSLRPDRVAFYSYAHVPWVSPGQRGYGDADLPSDVQKRALYETGRALLRDNGYEDVGMDHFALPHDKLFKAQLDGKLHRNFMGYTTTDTTLLVGLGASAISDAKYAYAQNIKKVEDYSAAVASNGLAVFKGHLQTSQDLNIKRIILEIACHGLIPVNDVMESDATLKDTLEEMCREGILVRDVDAYYVTGSGRPFIRNICSVFDRHLQAEKTSGREGVFSKAI